MESRHKQRGQSPLQGIPKSLVKVPNVSCPFGSLIFPFLADTEALGSRNRVGVDNLCTSVATLFLPAVFAPSTIIACYATDSRRKAKFGVKLQGLGLHRS